MAAIERKDRVKDQTSSTGTGNITIDGTAPTGYRTFLATHTNGCFVNYLIQSATGADWEIGRGQWNSGTGVLTRNSGTCVVISSSNANAAVNFPAGNKVVVSLPTARDMSPVFFDHTAVLGSNQIDYLRGDWQRWAPSAASHTLSIINWPAAGEYAYLVIEGVNLGAATITWPTINWVKSDGSNSTLFSDTGVLLQTSGTDFITLWTRNGGTTIYGKVTR